MSEPYPARWLGEELVTRLNPFLTPLGFLSGDALVWKGSPQETSASVTWKRESEELTVRYEFWGGRLVVYLKHGGSVLWTADAVVRFNEALHHAHLFIGERDLNSLRSSTGRSPDPS